ncbi:hypothetical protein D3C78_1298180 [compost metagenome]
MEILRQDIILFLELLHIKLQHIICRDPLLLHFLTQCVGIHHKFHHAIPDLLITIQQLLKRLRHVRISNLIQGTHKFLGRFLIALIRLHDLRMQLSSLGKLVINVPFYLIIIISFSQQWCQPIQNGLQLRNVRIYGFKARLLRRILERQLHVLFIVLGNGEQRGAEMLINDRLLLIPEFLKIIEQHILHATS